MSDIPDTVAVANQIVASQFPAFVVLFVVCTGLTAAVVAMWRLFRAELADCRRQHDDCQRQNRVLAQAVLDSAQGRQHEAKARAETVLMQ